LNINKRKLPDISVIIVNYRGWKRLAQCLDSLDSMEDLRFSHEVMIIDNHSDDGQLDLFRQRYPKFSFLLNAGNLGFSNGCNLGAANTHGSYLLFLNPDTIVSADALFGLLREARNRRLFSVISCGQFRENGAEERPFGEFPTLSNLTGWLRAFNRMVFRQKNGSFRRTDAYIYPDWISGSVVMIGRESYQKLGGWDEDFWMYFEDVDLCCRATLAGGEIVLLRNVTIEHNHGGASRINPQITALTKTEVEISRHVYISKHESGTKALYIHIFLIFNNLILGLLPAIWGILFFYVNGLSAGSKIYARLVHYYWDVLRSGKWLSKRSPNSR